jgi:prepilin-type N-terminal cleavage/methylation domain-containing protein
MNNRRLGFSIIELVVVIMVGSVLTSIAITSFSGVSGRFATRGDGDSVWLSRAGDVLEVLDFDEEFHVDIRTSTSSDLKVCMNARGFADMGCNNFTSPVTVTFSLASDTASVRVFTLGQMVIN